MNRTLAAMGVEGVWRSGQPFTHERIGAVAIYCSDGRFNEQFDEFLHAGLALPRYDRLAVPGGAGVLAGHLAAHREKEALLEQLRFLAVHHELERLVLITHRNCGFYLKKLHMPEAGLRERQERDLGAAAQAIRSVSPRLDIDAYFASVENDLVSIEPVPL